MSASLDLDPSQGFIALPQSLLTIDMSPGAFRALVEFCRMADPKGWSWPSLGQLSERIGRSRAAISGYVKELRALGLLTTVTQRMANGYNYRLRYQVTFWEDWRAKFGRRAEPPAKAASPAPSPERRVHPAERRNEVPNHIHENHLSETAQELNDLCSQWKSCEGHAPYPNFDRPVPTDLVAKTQTVASEPSDLAPQCTEKPIQALVGFLASKSLSPTSEQTAEFTMALESLEGLPVAANLLHRTLNKNWKPHWQRIPSCTWLKHLIKSVQEAHPEVYQRRILAGYLRRAQRAGYGPSTQISTRDAA